MKNLFLLIITLFAFNGLTQEPPLYKNLVYLMPIKAAKKEFKKNKDDYKTISLGNGVDWKMFSTNFVTNSSGNLVGIVLNDGSMFGINADNAALYITQTRTFFEDKGYTVIHEPEYWYAPTLVSPTEKYGLLLHDADKNIMVSLRVQPHPTERFSYSPVLGISNYKAFVSYMEANKAAIKKARDKTGF